MNKTALKNFSIWARNKLIEDITYIAGLKGVSASGIAVPLPQSTKDLQFFDIGTKEYAQVAGEEIKQRDALVAAIQAKEKDSDYVTAFAAVVEEIAYTWFNRLVAIRFMEVNDYLPSRIRVLSSENPAKNEPDLVTTPFDGDLEFTNVEQDRIMQLKDENKLDELFRMLFVKQCNKLHEVLPVMFEKTSDYTELLLSISFTDKDGIVYKLTHIDGITDEDWQDQVQIIGWLYQYYNTELKDETFALLKKNVKITKERVPAATQLFTPDWIVRYMVENSLGRLWVEGHPNDDLKANWKYYLEEAEQEPAVQEQLAQIRKEYAALTPEDIKVIDPCMGSGHILVYLFDVLMQIYESQGYTQRDAAQLILEKNLYGLDIDNRAAQLAYFAVMMKARQYDRRILTRDIQPHVFAIAESNGFNTAQLKYFGADLNPLEKNNAMTQAKSLIKDLHDAKEYGSILTVENYDWNLLCRFAEKIDVSGQMTLDSIGIDETQERLYKVIETGEALSQKYLICVTNPPYMGTSNMDSKLKNFVKNRYASGRYDLFAVFIEKLPNMLEKVGQCAMITQQTWMFQSGYQKLREKILSNTISSMIHLGPRAFDEISGEVVQSVAFSLKKYGLQCYKGMYCRAVTGGSAVEKEIEFFDENNRYNTAQNAYSLIPGNVLAYWIPTGVSNSFSVYKPMSQYVRSSYGLLTGDNEKYLRNWSEINFTRISFNGKTNSLQKWVPCNMGGSYRKWYSQPSCVALWGENGAIIRSSNKATIPDDSFLFKESVAWNDISTSTFAVRYVESGIVGGHTCPAIFAEHNRLLSSLSFLSSKVASYYLKFLSPTLHNNTGDVLKIPVQGSESGHTNTSRIAADCIDISKSDWDFFETSWGFRHHPLIRTGHSIDVIFNEWKQECDTRFEQLKANEEELNRIFIDIYGLQDELIPEVEDKDVTVRKADLGRDVRSLISYAVGCMFGRYSLDVDGLAYAGGKWDDRKYSTFIPDKDNCIPITDEPYFEDDIVGLFCNWMKKVYGEDALEGNLDFIAKALGNKGSTSREVIRNYFLNDFIKDHIKIYQKRPIYWLFDSGKQNGFKALVYMHRWDADTVGNLRIEYLHKIQHVYEREIQRMQETIDEGRDSRDVSRATKRKDKLQKQLKETKDYDAKLAHIALSRIEIDLDDGVKTNYEKVQTARDGKKMQILAKI